MKCRILIIGGLSAAHNERSVRHRPAELTPVMYPPAGLARNPIAAATSQLSANRPAGT